jgi:hypothetical protein
MVYVLERVDADAASGLTLHLNARNRQGDGPVAMVIKRRASSMVYGEGKISRIQAAMRGLSAYRAREDASLFCHWRRRAPGILICSSSFTIPELLHPGHG